MPDDARSVDTGGVYRSVSDGTTPSVWTSRLRLALPALALAYLCFGVVASITVNAESLPTYWGRVILIGLVWGVAACVIGGLTIALALAATHRRLRRTTQRLFPEGSSTELVLDEDVLIIRRPGGELRLPYGAIARIRITDVYIRIYVRDRARPELLPRGILPDPILGLLRARVGTAPAAVSTPDQEPTRSMVVPPGWSDHLAAVHRRLTLGSVRFWTAAALLVLLGALLGLLFQPWLWLLGPAVILIRAGYTYTSTRQALARALPAGSTAATYVLDDRFISQNAGGTRTLLFDDVRRATAYDDAVLLRLWSTRRPFLIARALLPPDTLQRLSRQDRRPEAGADTS